VKREGGIGSAFPVFASLVVLRSAASSAASVRRARFGRQCRSASFDFDA